MYSNGNAFKSQRWPNGAPNGPKGPGWHPQGYVAAKQCAWPRLACASILKIQNSVHFGAKWPHAKTNLKYLEHPHGPEGGCSPSWQHAPRCGPPVFFIWAFVGPHCCLKNGGKCWQWVPKGPTAQSTLPALGFVV